MNRKIAVTGIGLVTPLGIGAGPVWESLVQGKSGIGEITGFDTSGYKTRIAGEVRDFNPEDWMDRKEARRLDRFSQFALAAGVMAVNDAELDISKADQYRIGAVIGSGAGGINTIETAMRRLMNKGPDRVPPLSIPQMMINSASSAVCTRFGIRGPSFGVVNACSTGADAVVNGAGLIRSGEADIVLAGGTEASITPLSLAAFSACGALSSGNGDPQKASRPFDLHRDGFVMSEGSAVLVLELLEQAQARGARIYAELSGWGRTSDAYHITAPDTSGEPASKAIGFALEAAGLTSEQVGYINAHGTGTQLNDPVETRAIHLALGEQAKTVPVSSTKSMIGHMLGAAGAAEAGITALALKHRTVPPSINIDNQDPACDLNVVTEVCEAPSIEAALSNSFAFGGHNVCLALRRV